jgi:hypothetical protein
VEKTDPACVGEYDPHSGDNVVDGKIGLGLGLRLRLRLRNKL